MGTVWPDHSYRGQFFLTICGVSCWIVFVLVHVACDLPLLPGEGTHQKGGTKKFRLETWLEAPLNQGLTWSSFLSGGPFPLLFR